MSDEKRRPHSDDEAVLRDAMTEVEHTRRLEVLLADVRRACATLIAERVRILSALGLLGEQERWSEAEVLDWIRALRNVSELAAAHLDAHDDHDCCALGWTETEQRTAKALHDAIEAAADYADDSLEDWRKP